MKAQAVCKLLMAILLPAIVLSAYAQLDYVSSLQRDSIKVSLLTCTPGKVAYTMYGHSAIRVHDMTKNEDLVFNYGAFDYSEDNFIFRFVKGETDYILAAEYFDSFIQRYSESGTGITEQILNLTPEEKDLITRLLMENILPANRTYRYNWLYDNCTTRARDMIERAISGKVIYHAANSHKSARIILHLFNQVNRWMDFGENLILGYELDRPLTKRQQMFIPSYYAADADSATIVRIDGTEIPLVIETHVVLREKTEARPQLLDTPFILFGILFAVILFVAFFEWRRKKTYKWLDVALFVFWGLAGILVAFLFFFSEHAGVDSNMLVIFFNPLPLFGIPFLIQRKIKFLCWVILAEFALLLIALIVARQHVDPALLPLVSILLLRVVVNILFSQKK